MRLRCLLLVALFSLMAEEGAALDAPAGLSASTDSCWGIYLEWDSLPGTDSFYVRRDGFTAFTESLLFRDTAAPPGSSDYWVAGIAADTLGDSTMVTGFRRWTPAAPGTLVASDTSCQFVRLDWSASAKADSYAIFWNGIEKDVVVAGELVYRDTLAPGSYEYGVAATNLCGRSAVVSDSGAVLVPPYSPDSVWATSDSCGLVRVEWIPGSQDTGYYVYREDVLLCELAAGEPFHRDTLVPPGTYTYWVGAMGKCGRSDSVSAVGTRPPGAPSAPSTLSASDTSCVFVRLDWAAAAEADSYAVFRDGIEVAVVSGNVLIHCDTVGPGSYEYGVVSANLCGRSPAALDSGTVLGGPRVWHILPDGTGDAPTIKAGVDSAVQGDTVLIGCGTYYEHDIYVDSGVYIRSETGEWECAIIDAQGQGRVFQCDSVDSTTVLKGLTLTNGRSDGGAGLICSSASPLIYNCLFSENEASVGPAAYLNDSYPVFSGCAFIENTGDHLGGGGVAVFNSWRDTVCFRGCVFAENEGFYGWALSAWEDSRVEVSGCTFYSYMHPGYALHISHDPHDWVEYVVDHSLFYGFLVYRGRSGGARFACCDFYDPGSADPDGEWLGSADGNFEANPLLCDPEDSDFSVAANSPCVAAFSPPGCGHIGAVGVGCGWSDDGFGTGGGISGPESPSDHEWMFGLGSGQNELLQLQFVGEAGYLTVLGMTLKASGTGNDATGIALVNLVDDRDGDGHDQRPPDTLLVSGAYAEDDGELTLAVPGGWTVADGDTGYLVVSYDMKRPQVNGNTHTFSIVDMELIGGAVDLPIHAATKTYIGPTGVQGLQGLGAKSQSDFIEIHWDVQSRQDYSGFRVHRSCDEATYQCVTAAMIPNDAPYYPNTFSWTDETAEPGVTYWYKIEVVYHDGTTEVWDRAVSASTLVPAKFALRQTGPSPVRAARGTEFAYDIPMPGADVTIVLYDISGRRVASLVDGHVGPGTHIASLAGSDLEHLGSGVYFLRMEAGSFRETKRALVIR